MIQYVDDTTLCFQGKCKESLEIDCFGNSNSCLQFLSNVNLQTNNSKSNFIYFSGRRVPHEPGPSVVLNDMVIDEILSIKFLGIHIDKGLSWEKHVDVVCARMSSGIYALRKLAEFCGIHLLKVAYYGLVYPHMFRPVSTLCW
uniref:Reverse transcriptase domain-containing protein n=1 Tax=Homalodisca liturata TaxID=320908 RepID=A0A1B6IJT2_9HEMI